MAESEKSIGFYIAAIWVKRIGLDFHFRVSHIAHLKWRATVKVTFSHFLNIDEAETIASVEIDTLPVAGSIVYLQEGSDIRRWRVLDHNWLLSRLGEQTEHEVSVVVNLLPVDD